MAYDSNNNLISDVFPYITTFNSTYPEIEFTNTMGDMYAQTLDGEIIEDVFPQQRT